MEDSKWTISAFPRLPNDINAWVEPAFGFEANPTSALQHVCMYPGPKAVFDQIMSNPDLDVNYESRSFDGTWHIGTTAFVYLLLSIYHSAEEDEQILAEKFEMLEELVARDDFNINKPVTVNELDVTECRTPLSWFFELAFAVYATNVFDEETNVAAIEAIVAHPRIAPTPEEISKCAEYGVVVPPRPIRNLNKWKKACRCLVIYQFWWKVAGEGQHAPGGEGEKRSREEFEKDFA